MENTRDLKPSRKRKRKNSVFTNKKEVMKFENWVNFENSMFECSATKMKTNFLIGF